MQETIDKQAKRAKVLYERERNRLAKELMPIAIRQSMLLSEQSGVSYEDLLGEAHRGIAYVIENGRQDGAYFRYAKLCIRGFMLNYLRDRARVVKLPRHLTSLYLSEQKKLRESPEYRNLPDKAKADLLGASVDDLLESRSAITLSYSSLEFNDKDCSKEHDASKAHIELVVEVVRLGIDSLARQSKQNRQDVEDKVLAAFRTIYSEQSHEQD